MKNSFVHMVFLLSLVLSPLAVKAEDCSKVYSDMDEIITSTQSRNEQIDSLEGTVLNNIFNPSFRGPHVPYVQGQKKYLYETVLPLRKNSDQLLSKQMRDLMKRLKSCKKSQGDCHNMVNSSSRHSVREKNLGEIEGAVNFKKSIGR